MLLLIRRPLTNAFCGRLIRVGKTHANLLAIILVIHLSMVLQQAMGLKLFIAAALGTLGTRERIVALISHSKLLDSKKSFTANTTVEPTISHVVLKNSSPGALLGVKENRVL